MKDLITELLREKFILHDPATAASGKGSVIALSNRIVIPLKNGKGEVQETMIVRAHNMHLCIRMAARIIQSFSSNGPFLDRINPYDWEAAWDVVSGEYEQNFNPQRWIAVYNGGRVLFEKGERHPLLDIIENCHAGGAKRYEDAIPQAENVIRQSGKAVRIDYDGNVALNVNLEKMQGRIGVILRSPEKTTTFNFSAVTKKDAGLNFAQCLGAAAAFLEGIQLAFLVGMNGEKIKRGIIPRHSTEEKQTREAGIRLGRLNAEIANLEGSFEVRYRPEKPVFAEVVNDAEALAQRMLAPPKKN